MFLSDLFFLTEFLFFFGSLFLAFFGSSRELFSSKGLDFKCGIDFFLLDFLSLLDLLLDSFKFFFFFRSHFGGPGLELLFSIALNFKCSLVFFFIDFLFFFFLTNFFLPDNSLLSSILNFHLFFSISILNLLGSSFLLIIILNIFLFLILLIEKPVSVLLSHVIQNLIRIVGSFHRSLYILTTFKKIRFIIEGSVSDNAILLVNLTLI